MQATNWFREAKADTSLKAWYQCHVFLCIVFAPAASLAEADELLDCWKPESEDKTELRDVVVEHEARGDSAKLIVCVANSYFGAQICEKSKLSVANQYSGRDRQVKQTSATTAPEVGMQIRDF